MAISNVWVLKIKKEKALAGPATLADGSRSSSGHVHVLTSPFPSSAEPWLSKRGGETCSQQVRWSHLVFI